MFVGGTGVAVAPACWSAATGVLVGGTGVLVGGTGVLVGGTGVFVGGTGVGVGCCGPVMYFSSMPLPVPRLRVYCLFVALFQCSCTPWLAKRVPSPSGS